MPAPKTYPETVSHREFFRFAAHSEWQVFHEATMRALVAQLAAESEYWTQPEWGEKFATPAASSFIPALSDETRPNARDKIATWWRIGHERSEWAYLSAALRIEQLVRNHAQFADQIGVASKYPMPIPSDIASGMSDEDWEGLRQAIYVSGAMLVEDTGLLCIPATEMFFAFEAFSKAIASTRCGLFLEEVEDASVQHKEVWKVLKCLSANRRKDATCGKCKFREICPSSSEGETFAKIYARLIHIRILRDYREDVFFDRVTRDYLADAFFRMSMKALMLADKYLSHSLGGFLRTPVHLELTLEKIRSMHPHAPQIEAPT